MLTPEQRIEAYMIVHIQFRNEVSRIEAYDLKSATELFFKWCSETQSDPLEYELKQLI